MKRLKEPLVGNKGKCDCCAHLSDGTKSLIRLLVVLLLERIAFCSVFSTIFEFTHQHLKFSSSCSTAAALLFSAFTFLLAPFFSVLIDRKTGYIPTLLSAFIFYILGSSLILYSATQTVISSGQETTDTPIHSVRAVYIAGLVVVTLSASAVRAALLPCMAEQLSDGHAKRNTLMAFCSWAFVVMHIGPVITTIPSSFVVESPGFKKGMGQYSSGFFWLYLWPICALIPVLLILIIWKNVYKSPDPRQEMGDIPRVSLGDIIRTACGCYRDSSRPEHYDPDALPFRDNHDKLQYEKRIERKKLAVLVPVLAATVVYFADYSQIQSGFKDQALHLDLRMGETVHKSVNCSSLPGHRNCSSPLLGYSNCSTIPAHGRFLTSSSVIQTFLSIAVLLTLAAIPTLIRPCYEKFFSKELTIMKRIQWGLVFSLLGISFATVLEAVRLRCTPFRFFCMPAGDGTHILVYSSLSVFWQVPQYALFGMGIAFTSVAAAEFALSRAPARFRSTAFGCYWLAMGLGYFLGLALYYAMSAMGLYYVPMENVKGIRVDKNDIVEGDGKGRAWAYFLFLTILSIGNLLAFTWIKYRHRDVLAVDRARALDTYTVSPM